MSYHIKNLQVLYACRGGRAGAIKKDYTPGCKVAKRFLKTSKCANGLCLTWNKTQMVLIYRSRNRCCILGYINSVPAPGAAADTAATSKRRTEARDNTHLLLVSNVDPCNCCFNIVAGKQQS